MTKIQKILASGSAFGAALLAAPTRILANTINIDDAGSELGIVSTVKFDQIVSTLISVLLGVAGIISFIMLLWGGLQWILSGGDKEGTEKARKRITAALIGLAVVFSAYALIYIVGTLFGIDAFTFTLPQIGA